MSYKVLEIFESIQGEGRYTGMPMLFIRFAGCNLNCEWCDTILDRPVIECELEDIDSYIHDSDLRHICLTGGEPLLQDMESIIADNQTRFFHIETNGTMPLPLNFANAWIVCSPKKDLYDLDYMAKHTNEIKYVLKHGDKLPTLPLLFKGTVYLNPMAPARSMEQPCIENVSWCVRQLRLAIDKYPLLDIRLGIQAHKCWGIL